MKSFHSIEGSIVAPQGFLAAGIHCDVFQRGKASRAGRKRDLAVIVSEVPAQAAGMFTTNQICAAPVKLCVEHIAALSERTGKTLHLGLEPEPLGYFETSDETVAFFDQMENLWIESHSGSAWFRLVLTDL